LQENSETEESGEPFEMRDLRSFYIDGKWTAPVAPRDVVILNPATDEPIATISLGSSADVNHAVAAARDAFPTFSETSLDDRKALLRRIVEVYDSKKDEMAKSISLEMGAPISLSRAAQAPAGRAHFGEILKVLDRFSFETCHGTTLFRKEPIGVCALITPWNWPMNQIACKVAPALAAGCTMVLKPSELAPLSAHLFTQILENAGVPKGVFNLVHGEGATVGAALASHPDVAMVSFTGSVRGGVSVAVNAAPTVKRVTQELGSKSANIILEDADFSSAVADGVRACFRNSGQSCNAPTRMLVPRRRMSEASEIASQVARATKVGDPLAEDTALGPLVSKAQFDRVQGFISLGIEEGARLAAGGLGRPDGLSKGNFAKPTVFADVQNSMKIAQEEIFGPVLCLISYDNEEDAIRIANDTPSGLSGYVSSSDSEHAYRVAKRIRAGNVHINNARVDFAGSFGGYKQSGNGREWGEAGLEEFLEKKSVFGYSPKSAPAVS
jgi:aldehyde dehydrogenase (NAD+)